MIREVLGFFGVMPKDGWSPIVVKRGYWFIVLGLSVALFVLSLLQDKKTKYRKASIILSAIMVIGCIVVLIVDINQIDGGDIICY